MKIINKNDFKELMKIFPNGGIVFSEYPTGDLHITDGDFGATLVTPLNGEIFDYDWNIEEYKEQDEFIMFNNNDILQMIQTLTTKLKIELEY